ncbi:MAG: hypothetical protein ABIJ53_10560 [Verrucomicrobiota bacterium]
MSAGYARRVTTLTLRKRRGNPKNLPAKHAKKTLKLKGKYFLFSRPFACFAGNVPISFLVFYGGF